MTAHPPWCQPGMGCDIDLEGGEHRAVLATIPSPRPGYPEITVVATLARDQAIDEEPMIEVTFKRTDVATSIEGYELDAQQLHALATAALKAAAIIAGQQ